MIQTVLQSRSRSRLPLILGAALTAVAALAKADEPAVFTVDGRLGDSAVEGLQVALECRVVPGDEPLASRSAWLPSEGTAQFEVVVPPDADVGCYISAEAPPGLELRYRGDGGSAADIGGEGCRFSEVRPGHANFCQIQGRSQGTSITVYKKWIGAREREPDVRIDLVCAGQRAQEGRDVNSGMPGQWSLEVSDPEGIVCNVVEPGSDDYVPDSRDCQNLLILPGSEEECTLVNTKVVKMIDMLNRYGLAIMILVFMVAGMLAARRFVP